MNKERIADLLSTNLGILPKEIRDRVPPQCRRCPTLLGLAQTAMMEKDWDDRYARKALRQLDQAERTKDKLPGAAAIHRVNAQAYTERSERMLEGHDERQETIEKLAAATDQCPGSILGNLTLSNSADVLLSKVAGQYWGVGPRERSCPNPSFGELQDDPNVNDALRYGNWVGGIVEDRPE